jgi:hypothetical protein
LELLLLRQEEKQDWGAGNACPRKSETEISIASPEFGVLFYE